MAIGTLDAVLYVVQTRNESENADLSECEGSESESECSSSSSVSRRSVTISTQYGKIVLYVLNQH